MQNATAAAISKWVRPGTVARPHGLAWALSIPPAGPAEGGF